VYRLRWRRINNIIIIIIIRFAFRVVKRRTYRHHYIIITRAHVLFTYILYIYITFKIPFYNLYIYIYLRMKYNLQWCPRIWLLCIIIIIMSSRYYIIILRFILYVHTYYKYIGSILLYLRRSSPSVQRYKKI